MASSSDLRVPDRNSTVPMRAGRESRRQMLLDTAAVLFREKGFESTSVRDIATASGLLPGSIYCHFPSKEHMFLAVQKRGIEHLTEAVQAAVRDIPDPWARLEAACVAHMTAILGERAPFGVTPERSLALWEQVAASRDEYENIFRQLVDDLPLPAGTSRKYLRLALLGAMNWVPGWYRSGRDSPERIAVEFVWLLRCGLDPE